MWVGLSVHKYNPLKCPFWWRYPYPGSHLIHTRFRGPRESVSKTTWRPVQPFGRLHVREWQTHIQTCSNRPHLMRPNKDRPRGGRDDMRPPWQKSRRIYGRLRCPHISDGRRWRSCRQPACLWPRQLRHGTDRRMDHAIPKCALGRGHNNNNKTMVSRDHALVLETSLRMRSRPTRQPLIRATHWHQRTPAACLLLAAT